MSLTDRQIGELEQLLSDLADGRLTPGRRAALGAILRAAPEARDYYIRFMSLCCDLHEQAAKELGSDEQQCDDCQPECGGSRRLDKRWRLGWAVASGVAVVVLAVAVAVALWPTRAHRRGAGDEQKIVGHLANVVGKVEINGAGTQIAPAKDGRPVLAGQTVSTLGSDAQAEVMLVDGTSVVVAGDSRVVFAADDQQFIHIEYGNVTASVKRRGAGAPLVFSTPEALVEVLGTRLSVSRGQQRTRVAVLQGDVRVQRLSDRRAVRLTGGETAEVSPQADLRPLPLCAVPDHWSLEFSAGLPHGWQTGQLVFDDLPEGSSAAVCAVCVVDQSQHGQRRCQIRSHNAWNEGLFTLHDDSWIHIRYRVQQPGTFLLYLVCRQYDFGHPVSTVLTSGNLKQTQAGRWHTLSLPLSDFRRTRHQDVVPLDGKLVAFFLVFDAPENNCALTIERIWVTRGKPAEPPSPIQPQEGAPPHSQPQALSSGWRCGLGNKIRASDKTTISGIVAAACC